MNPDEKTGDQRPARKNTNPLVQLQANPTSRALAIKAMCAYCVGCTWNSLERGFRTTIAECDVNHCPLHPFRPYVRKTALDCTTIDIANSDTDDSGHD